MGSGSVRSLGIIMQLHQHLAFTAAESIPECEYVSAGPYFRVLRVRGQQRGQDLSGNGGRQGPAKHETE